MDKTQHVLLKGSQVMIAPGISVKLLNATLLPGGSPTVLIEVTTARSASKVPATPAFDKIEEKLESMALALAVIDGDVKAWKQPQVAAVADLTPVLTKLDEMSNAVTADDLGLLIDKLNARLDAMTDLTDKVEQIDTGVRLLLDE